MLFASTLTGGSITFSLYSDELVSITTLNQDGVETTTQIGFDCGTVTHFQVDLSLSLVIGSSYRLVISCKRCKAGNFSLGSSIVDFVVMGNASSLMDGLDVNAIAIYRAFTLYADKPFIKVL